MDQIVADDVREDVLVNDETALYDFLGQEFEDLDDKYEDTLEYSQNLFQMYDRALWNQRISLFLGKRPTAPSSSKKTIL